jgi:hypothetical protein
VFGDDRRSGAVLDCTGDIDIDMVVTSHAKVQPWARTAAWLLSLLR